MSNAPARSVPDASHWLCEGCGYVLEGLPADARCPECGKPTSESAAELRSVPLWERPWDAGILHRFVATTIQVIFRPSVFYRSMATRDSRGRSARFAQIHTAVASVLFGIAAWLHLDWSAPGSANAIGIAWPWWMAIVLSLLAYLFLIFTIGMAARLTAWEAAYRGIRLPLEVVRRGLDYHAAHYLPVALLAAGTLVVSRWILLHHNSADAAMRYVVVLSAEVVASAAYLFVTYWKAMRNMMYASR
jgi:hypothetical protein